MIKLFCVEKKKTKYLQEVEYSSEINCEKLVAMTTAVKTTNSAYQNKIHIFVHRKVHRMGYIGYLAVEILPHTALQNLSSSVK